jgi:hypothetical protein
MSYDDEYDFDDEESTYREGTYSELKGEHEELYGLLLHSNRQIDDAGDSIMIIFLIVTFGAGLALHMEWLDEFFGADLERLRSWVVYVVGAVVSTLLAGWGIGFLQKRAYRRLREPILYYLETHGISPLTLIAKLEGDDALDDVAEQLQGDKSFTP